MKEKKRFTVQFEGKIETTAGSREEAIDELERLNIPNIRIVNIETNDINIEPPAVEVKFIPQKEENGKYYQVDAKGNNTWLVPLEDAVDRNKNLYKDDSRQSDSLKNHPNSPYWVENWEGPFYIEVKKCNSKF